MIRKLINKQVNGKVAAIVIVLSGVAVGVYAAYEIDWANFRLSFLSIFFPLLFIFVVCLFALKVVSNKDVEITSHKTDKKISDAIYRFNQKTSRIQNIALCVVVLLPFLIYLWAILWSN